VVRNLPGAGQVEAPDRRAKWLLKRPFPLVSSRRRPRGSTLAPVLAVRQRPRAVFGRIGKDQAIGRPLNIVPPEDPGV